MYPALPSIHDNPAPTQRRIEHTVDQSSKAHKQHPSSQARPDPSHPIDRPRAHPHRSQALPAGPHRAAPGKPPAEQRPKQRRVALGCTKWGSRGYACVREGYPKTHSPRHGRHLHLPFAVNGLGRTLSFARERCFATQVRRTEPPKFTQLVTPGFTVGYTLTPEAKVSTVRSF